LKEAPARVVAYFQAVRCVFALFLQLLFSPAGAVAADASAGDLLGFPAFQFKQTPCSV